MKIQVNKNQQAINFKTHVGTIIMIAEQTAKQGMTAFKYPIPRDQGINYWTLISEVEEQTEQSVYVGQKSVSDTHIKFTIRD
jgi:starvation-inducible outer membrane lipoprotein